MTEDNEVFVADTVVGVVGAGAMGAGIAQVAAQRGHRVLLADAMPASIIKARDGHVKAINRDVEKGRLTRTAADETLARITYVDGATAAELQSFGACDFVIEAIVENIKVKQSLFRLLESVVRDGTVLASNTSSLSIAALAGACSKPDRVLGVHFFNPATLMPLVEIIPAISTAADVTSRARTLIDGWGKITVHATDTPGFIVNRVARPFYSESLRLLEEGVADIATIDWAMREFGKFRMGPFELMDLIGNDVNFAVTSSVFEGMFFDSRYRPANTQRRMVESGLLGRKSGRGYYDYRDGAKPLRAREDEGVAHVIVNRVLAMLVNAAVDAVHHGVASPRDIELSMTKGVNYPKGLLAWGDEIGGNVILERLDDLHAEYLEGRYRASALLRACVRSGAPLLS
ncbi:MAG: 3-hydroxyacyl-CoA dehydrogenase NAD-binding domain-containing protein [Gemmatimonadota bacterium]|nr:3-hydroxyacyl-CoA dehydrogenase NAD-binding domain-containing protein [Gemmatimonadota bacterium]